MKHLKHSVDSVDIEGVKKNKVGRWTRSCFTSLDGQTTTVIFGYLVHQGILWILSINNMTIHEAEKTIETLPTTNSN